MSKLNGLGSTVTVDDDNGSGQTISNSVHNYEFSTPYGVQDVTGVDKSAMERILLLADFSVTFNGQGLDTTANKSHDVFSGDLTVSRTTVIQPTSGSTPSLTNECLFTDYSVSRDDGGGIQWSAPGVLSNGTVPTWVNS
jgi:hypothetical protein